VEATGRLKMRAGSSKGADAMTVNRGFDHAGRAGIHAREVFTRADRMLE